MTAPDNPPVHAQALEGAAEGAGTREDVEDVERALRAAETGSAGHWPTVAAVLRDEVLRLREVAAGFRRVAEDPETVERVAKAMWSGPPEWDDSVVQNLEQYGKTWRAMAAAALAALRGGEQQ